MKKSSHLSVQEIAHDISYHPNKRLDIFQKYSVGIQAEVFNLLSPHTQQTIIEKFSNKQLIKLIDHMDLDQAGRTLARIKNSHKRGAISHRLKYELKEKVEQFLQFSERAEFGLLSFNYILLSENATILDVSHSIDQHYKETGKSPEILVQKNGKCIGEVSLGALVRERNVTKIGKLVSPVVSIRYNSSKSDIAKTFTTVQKKKVVVVDTDGSVIGIIYTDEVLKLFKNGPAEALYDFAGVSDSERVFDTVMKKVDNRYKWLLLNLFTAFLAGSVVSMFEATLSELVILAVYMPIIAGMGGNASAQTLAVMVRGITLGEVSIHNVKNAIKKEALAGIMNGLIVGMIVALAASFFHHSPLLGLIAGIAIFCNLIVAGLFGSFIPILMKKLGKDPATSATIFITTATDVFGFFIFLGLATLFLV